VPQFDGTRVVGVDWTKEVTYAGITQLYRDLIALRR
jgi:hypothetical protein